ncbi:MAG: VCBS repeat-containing protein [Planctomycetes bacterium]|nr:VCBS repeat-containing protein [Planctomycetota bacterium]
MKSASSWSLSLCLLTTASAAAAADASLSAVQTVCAGLTCLVNPALQPFDVYDRYLAVLALEVVAVDVDRHTVGLVVRQVIKGEFAAHEISLTATAEAVAGAFQQLPEPGLAVVAFVGKGRGAATDVLFYAGGEGQWQVGAVRAAGDAAAPAAWEWTAVLKDEMYGTFNGHPAQLAAMLRDHAAGRGFFPAHAFTRFRPEQVLGTLAGPIAGVALYDLDGDGRLDALATSPAGCALFLQRSGLRFDDATAASGLAGVAGRSIGIADVDGDGRADLLIDGRIMRQGEDGRFALTTWLPPAADRGVVMSVFADFDHDGCPDVLVAQSGSGLHAWRHPGKGGGAYLEVTQDLGLARAETGAGKCGLFSFGNLRGDGRDGLFIAIDGGLLLEKPAHGGFAPTAMPAYDLAAPAGGRTGGGTMADIFESSRPTLAFTNERGVDLVDVATGQPRDVARYGNETVVVTPSCQGVIAEDLHAAGNLDLYAFGRAPETGGTLYVNRGYGSFMVSTRYQADAIPGRAHQSGAGGVAAGDVDGDGANDLLLGGLDGRLVLLVNGVLAERGGAEHPGRQESVLARTARLAVAVSGPRGVVGATITVLAAQDRVVTQRTIGGNPATGCRGPDAATLAIREPGDYRVRVEWSDGCRQLLPVTLVANTLTNLRAVRP